MCQQWAFLVKVGSAAISRLINPDPAGFGQSTLKPCFVYNANMRVHEFATAFLTASLGSLAFSQAGRLPQVTSDFSPPHGILRDGQYDILSWGERLLIATSVDGLTFTRTEAVITDRARSPYLIVADGLLYLYYSTPDGERTRSSALTCAISADRGKSWIFKYVQIRHNGKIVHPVAPAVRVLKNGVFRLYFSEDVFSPSIFYAEASDGIHFTKEGAVRTWERAFGSMLSGLIVTPVGDSWHIYQRDGNADGFGMISHGWSGDGESFTFPADPRIVLEDFHPASAVDLGDGRSRFYGSTNQTTDGILSYLTRDGIRFSRDPGTRLALDPPGVAEKDHVKDAAVVRLSDGTYFMVYVAGIP